MSGYCGTVLRIDLSRGEVHKEDLDRSLARQFIGGRGLASAMLAREIDPAIDALSPDNKLLLATGPLTATPAPASARYMAVTKSPLTGLIACSNSGGFWGPELKNAGYDMLILEGRSPQPCWISIRDGDVQLHDATALWGKRTGETTDALLAEMGDPKARVLNIAPAGENLSPIAAIMNDRYRAAGRSGVGAVMGSKNLKAIVVRGTGKAPVADPDRARQTLREMVGKLKEHPITGQGLPTYGTAVLVNVINEHGVYPTNNFQQAYFPRADEASGEVLAEKFLVTNEACYRCPIACGRVCQVGDVQGGGPEYETLWAFSADCGVSDLEPVIRANELCNEYGLDTISAGATIACAMELYTKGFLPKDEVDGPPLEFGSGEAVVEWTAKMGKAEGLGAKLAQGSHRLAEMYGHPELAMTVKKQELPAYDPRGVQGHGLQYATSNRGGCHVRGYLISPEILGVPEKHDPRSIEGKAALAKAFQDLTAVIDSLGVCLFTSFALGAEEYAQLARGILSDNWTAEEMWAAGERIWNLERVFNLRAGLDPADDTLPKRLLKEPIPDGPSKGEVHRLGEMLPEYYQQRGWSPEGKPEDQKLAALGLA